jgi:uncharacterized protein (DUF1015 family)
LEFHKKYKTPETSGIMTLLCDMDDPGLVIWPTHRIISNTDGFSADRVLKAAEEAFTVELTERGKLPELLRKQNQTVGFYGGGKAALLTLKNNAFIKKATGKSDAYCALDVALLHHGILEPLFGIGAEQLAAQTYVTYTRSAAEALDSADGDAQCAFLLNAATMEQLTAVTLAGEKMPQKSTYFYPKLITGLVMKMLNRA